jgi:hypothetical protein
MLHAVRRPDSWRSHLYEAEVVPIARRCGVIGSRPGVALSRHWRRRETSVHGIGNNHSELGRLTVIVRVAAPIATVWFRSIDAVR